jgi:hypothetical protein
MSRAEERLKLVQDGGPPRCPTCREQLLFRTDTQGRTIAHCECGYRAYVERRTGKRETPAT